MTDKKFPCEMEIFFFARCYLCSSFDYSYKMPISTILSFAESMSIGPMGMKREKAGEQAD